MLIQGKHVRVQALDAGLYELVFDNTTARVNALSQAAVAEFSEALLLITSREDLRGLLITSDHESFIVGADIPDLTRMFRYSDSQVTAMLQEMRTALNRLEDLPVPSVVAINGAALGGGFGLCLACDYRVAAEEAQLGLPEVNLGLCSGWGGTVRLPRLIGLDHAIKWICRGQATSAGEALRQGAVDAVVPLEQLRAAAVDLLRRCVAGEFDYQSRRAEKRAPLALNAIELTLTCESARAVIKAKVGPHYPAPMVALNTMKQHAVLEREAALEVEADHFASLVRGPEFKALINLYLKEQQVKRIDRAFGASGRGVARAGVVGAGIMGSGIAGLIAAKAIPVVLQDVSHQALDAGLDSVGEQLESRFRRQRIGVSEIVKSLNRITPTLSRDDFSDSDFVIESIVEQPAVKTQVLADVEASLKPDAVLVSNTSTIAIGTLAQALTRPEQFSGMHFFNPVQSMQLVEVIRGELTSDDTLARTVRFARALGKTPIVINDCPGFLITRVLYPYLRAFGLLLRDGIDLHRVDGLMEEFGWPMGPGALLDVIGLDTVHHANVVLAAGYPDRMGLDGETAIDRLYHEKRLGRKSGRGFYRYVEGRNGLEKEADPALMPLIADLCAGQEQLSDQQVVERMMIPLCIEAVRALEEGVVGSVAEADVAFIRGLGFPAFRGGIFHYIDRIGLAAFVHQADAYSALGPLYRPTDSMRAMAVAGEHYEPSYSRAGAEK